MSSTAKWRSISIPQVKDMRLYSYDIGHDVKEEFNKFSVHLREGTVPDRIERANQRNIERQEMVRPLSSILLLQAILPRARISGLATAQPHLQA